MDAAKKKMITKQEKHLAREKAINDFLLQFAFTIACSILLTLVYNGLMGRYGTLFALGMNDFTWGAMYSFAAITAGLFGAYMFTKKKIFWTITPYAFALFFMFAWITVFQRIMAYISLRIHFLQIFGNTELLIRMMYIILVLAVAAEIALYFVRVAKIKKQRG